MSKVHIIEGKSEKLVSVHCPGCNMWHPFRVHGQEGQPVWSWNESHDQPTFHPSMLVNKSHPGSRCHSFVRDGKIEFLSDCHHDLKGQAVDLPDLNEEGDVING